MFKLQDSHVSLWVQCFTLLATWLQALEGHKLLWLPLSISLQKTQVLTPLAPCRLVAEEAVIPGDTSHGLPEGSPVPSHLALTQPGLGQSG